MVTRLGKNLTYVRKNGDLWWLRPDGKIEVTIENVHGIGDVGFVSSPSLLPEQM